MHRSRLSVVLIDCPLEKMDAGVEFWSHALGKALLLPDDPSSPYVGLEGKYGNLQVGLQSIDGESRVHLDIETDDVEAEVQRLEAIGARCKEQVESWWVMEAPSGHVFCVVPPQSDDFTENAQVWED